MAFNIQLLRDSNIVITDWGTKQYNNKHSVHNQYRFSTYSEQNQYIFSTYSVQIWDRFIQNISSAKTLDTNKYIAC